MKKLCKGYRRVALGKISQSTLGGIRGVIEPFGLYTASIQLG